MAFPFVAVASAALGIGSSLFGSASQNRQREAENAEKQDNYKRARSAARAATLATDQQNDINYAWQVAQTEAIRFQEAQEKADYEFTQSRLTESALKNLEINEQAIYDQFFTSENLRATQESLAYEDDLSKLGRDARRSANEANYRIDEAGRESQASAKQAAAELDAAARDSQISSSSFGYELGRRELALGTAERAYERDMTLLSLEANDAARQYMTRVMSNSLQQQQEALRANRQIETLVANQVLEQQLDTLQSDIQFAASLTDRGRAKASGLGRGVSASTARSLQMNIAKELGRSFGELKIRQQQRNNSLATMNATMQGETAKGLARFALDSSQALKQLASSNFNVKTRAKNLTGEYGERTLGEFALDNNYLSQQERLAQAGFQSRGENIINQEKIAQGRFAASARFFGQQEKLAQEQFKVSGAYRTNQFEKLTVPSFELAGRQGQRELDSLFVRTQGQLDEASMPFRESIIFDPQKPLPGMYTDVKAPTYAQGPSLGSTIGGAVVAGVNGALKGTYTKQGGGLGWF